MDFDPYNVVVNGVKLDPYRVCEAFQITHPAIQQIVKKALRFGTKHKDQEQDARDIITSAQRFLDMREEEREWNRQLELPLAEAEKSRYPQITVGEGCEVPPPEILPLPTKEGYDTVYRGTGWKSNGAVFYACRILMEDWEGMEDDLPFKTVGSSDVHYVEFIPKK